MTDELTGHERGGDGWRVGEECRVGDGWRMGDECDDEPIWWGLGTLLFGSGTWADGSGGSGCLVGDVWTFATFLGELWEGETLVGTEEGGGGWRYGGSSRGPDMWGGFGGGPLYMGDI